MSKPKKTDFTEESILNEYYENRYVGIQTAFYLKFSNGGFTLRKELEHKHYVGNYQVRLKGHPHIFDILDIFYDTHCDEYTVSVVAGIFGTVISKVLNTDYDNYIHGNSGSLMLPVRDCILMRDDKTLRGEKDGI